MSPPSDFGSIFSHIWTEYVTEYATEYVTEYVAEFSPNAGKYTPEKLRIQTLFMQWSLQWRGKMFDINTIAA